MHELNVTQDGIDIICQHMFPVMVKCQLKQQLDYFRGLSPSVCDTLTLIQYNRLSMNLSFLLKKKILVTKYLILRHWFCTFWHPYNFLNFCADVFSFLRGRGYTVVVRRLTSCEQISSQLIHFTFFIQIQTKKQFERSCNRRAIYRQATII